MEHSIELRINPFTFAQLSTIKEARISNGEKIVSFRNGAGKKKKKKWINDLNVRLKIIKLLEENVSFMLFDIGFSNLSWGSVFSGKGNKGKKKPTGLNEM